MQDRKQFRKEGLTFVQWLGISYTLSLIHPQASQEQTTVGVGVVCARTRTYSNSLPEERRIGFLEQSCSLCLRGVEPVKELTVGDLAARLTALGYPGY